MGNGGRGFRIVLEEFGIGGGARCFSPAGFGLTVGRNAASESGIVCADLSARTLFFLDFLILLIASSYASAKW